MRKINYLSSGLLISLLLFGCSPSNKVKEYMLNDYQFSAAEDNANDIIRLTMNKDDTYEFCYKKKTSSNDFDIKINDKWELVLSFTYKWTYNNTSYKDLKMTVKSDVGIFKLNNCFNNNELQNYLALDDGSYYLWATKEEVNKEIYKEVAEDELIEYLSYRRNEKIETNCIRVSGTLKEIEDNERIRALSLIVPKLYVFTMADYDYNNNVKVFTKYIGW